jgi:serine protease Do
VSSQLEQYYDLATSKGVMIYNLVEGAPGEKFGLRQGDIITQMDGTSVLEPNDVERILAKHKPNDKIKLRIYRGKKTRELSIKLDELPRLANLPRGII